jgi:DNA-binding MarR family transcriptional regulator
MKPLATRSSENDRLEEDSASLVMATVPVVMGAFRGEMRANRPAGLSVPQFRTLIFVDKRAGASISDIAEHLGLALSTASKLVDGLVKRGYVERATAVGDRRRVLVTLTDSGKAALDATRAQAHARVREHLAALSPAEEQAVVVAMRALYSIFRPGAPITPIQD